MINNISDTLCFCSLYMNMQPDRARPITESRNSVEKVNTQQSLCTLFIVYNFGGAQFSVREEKKTRDKGVLLRSIVHIVYLHM